MNQFPLMRIQGRNALKVQSTLNRGLSFVHGKNKEPKRQCNVCYRIIEPISNEKDRRIIVKEQPKIKRQACSDAQKLHWLRYKNLQKLLDLINGQDEEKRVKDALSDKLIKLYWDKKDLFDEPEIVLFTLQQSFEY